MKEGAQAICLRKMTKIISRIILFYTYNNEAYLTSDIFHLKKLAIMYAPFCKEFQKKKCDSVNQAGNDFYLAHRECDGEPDCDDLTDERSCDGLPDSVFVSGKI